MLNNAFGKRIKDLQYLNSLKRLGSAKKRYVVMALSSPKHSTEGKCSSVLFLAMGLQLGKTAILDVRFLLFSFAC